MSPVSATTKYTSKSQLVDFLRRTNNVGLYVEEPGTCEGEENWAVIDKKQTQDDEDNEEWVLVRKTEAEKHEFEVRMGKRGKP